MTAISDRDENRQRPQLKLESSLAVQNLRQSEGALYYGQELITDPVGRWSREQKLELLDWHPLFTGRCPSCETTIVQPTPRRSRWRCETCGWIDESA